MGTRLAAALVSAVLIAGSAPADPRPAAPQTHEHVDARHGHNHRYADRGVVVRALPNDATAVGSGRDRYWYSGGNWYSARGTRFIVVAPPVGVVAEELPPYYTTLMIGGIPYYYANEVYYAWRDAARGYQIVERPPGADEAQVVTPATAAAGAPPTGADSVFAYPQNGQTAERQEQDRLECHRRAAEQAGVEPARSAGELSPQQSAAERADYFRAMNGCLRARGYTVR
jgi:hypothetical protein